MGTHLKSFPPIFVWKTGQEIEGGGERHSQPTCGRAAMRARSQKSMRLKRTFSQGGQVWAKVLYRYRAEYDEDLAIDIGDIIKVTDPNVGEGWWQGMSMRTGQVGIFPINHVEPCAPPENTNPAPPRAAKAANPGPPPRGARGIAGGAGGAALVGKPVQAGGGQKAGGGGGGRSGGGGGGGGSAKQRPKGGANSRSRFGIWSSNLAIYAGVMWVILGFALLLWAGQGEPGAGGLSPWLHECAQLEPYCRCYWDEGLKCPVESMEANNEYPGSSEFLYCEATAATTATPTVAPIAGQLKTPPQGSPGKRHLGTRRLKAALHSPLLSGGSHSLRPGSRRPHG